MGVYGFWKSDRLCDPLIGVKTPDRLASLRSACRPGKQCEWLFQSIGRLRPMVARVSMILQNSDFG